MAYLRFASVYRGFESLADFEAEIATLRAARAARTTWRTARGRLSARPDQQDAPAVTAAAGLTVRARDPGQTAAHPASQAPGCAASAR